MARAETGEVYSLLPREGLLLPDPAPVHLTKPGVAHLFTWFPSELGPPRGVGDLLPLLIYPP